MCMVNIMNIIQELIMDPIKLFCLLREIVRVKPYGCRICNLMWRGKACEGLTSCSIKMSVAYLKSEQV